MREQKPSLDLGALAKALQEAQAAYADAETQYSVAGSARCTALNRLNNAQRALDAAMAEYRKDAPRDSAWQSDNRLGISVTVS